MFEFTIDTLAFHSAIIVPAFADIIPEGFPFKGLLNEFSLMDEVPSKRPIIDIRRAQNIMQRRDASCDLIYKKVFGATTRSITTDEVYGAAKQCKNEFYQGALKDWRAKDPLFGNKILPYFQGAINTDIASNAYFGDVERVPGVADLYSTNIFDGVFKWIKRYIAAGVIPASQTKAIADGTDFSVAGGAGGAAGAYALLKSMYDAQSVLMFNYPDAEKAFYVSKEIAKGYEDYLIAIGSALGNIQYLENGVKNLFFKGIPVLIENMWTPVITQIKGSAGYAAVLTIRGNFIFATDKNYGEGEDGKTALMVWYEKKDLSWYFQLFLKAGTQIALPEFTVVALTAFS